MVLFTPLIWNEKIFQKVSGNSLTSFKMSQYMLVVCVFFETACSLCLEFNLKYQQQQKILHKQKHHRSS